MLIKEDSKFMLIVFFQTITMFQTVASLADFSLKTQYIEYFRVIFDSIL